MQKNFSLTVTNKNLIVTNHRIYNINTLPGVVVLEMIYRVAYSFLKTYKFDLRNVVFKSPIVTCEKFDKHIKLSFVEEGAIWKITVRSKKIYADETPCEEIEENLECELCIIDDEDKIGDVLDINHFKKNAVKIFDIDEIYAIARKVNINHYSFMKTIGTVYQLQEEELMELSVNELIEFDTNRFYVHPAFLDCSTFAGFSSKLLIPSDVNNYPYIPFSIKRFHLYQAFPKKIYVHSKLHLDFNTNCSLDVLSNDIKIYNESGICIGVIEGFYSKRIRNSYAIEKLLKNPLDKQNIMEQDSAKQDSTEDIKTDRKYINWLSFLKEKIANMVNVSIDSIDINGGFYDLGLDSAQLLEMVQYLESQTKHPLYPTLLFEYPTINRLAHYFLKNKISLNIVDNSNIEDDTSLKNTNDLYITTPQWCQQKENVYSNTISTCSRFLFFLDYDKLSLSNSKSYCINSRNEVISEFKLAFNFLITSIQELLEHLNNEKILIQIVVSKELHEYYIESFSSVLKTLSIENGKIFGQFILIESYELLSSETLLNILENERETYSNSVRDISYTGKRLTRNVKLLEEIQLLQPLYNIYKQEGVYIISGGLGGIGILLTKHLLKQGVKNVLLLGHTELNESRQHILQELNQFGGNVVFEKVDIAILNELKTIYQETKRKYGEINGIFHCAGVLNDQLLSNRKDKDYFLVFKPKLIGLSNLDEVSKEDHLDFIISFSSISSFIGSVGQSDYATANACMDIFMEERRKQVKRSQRHGLSISINWPLWEEGGMQVSKMRKREISLKAGLVPLPTTVALPTLDKIVYSKIEQAVVFYGDSNIYKEFTTSINKNFNNANNIATFDDDIAIIGVAGKYPHANSLSELYSVLKNGKDCIDKMPLDRWEGYDFGFNVNDIYSYGGFIDDIDKFEPLFFNISPHHAKMMDPQIRLFLEIAWNACEDAGFLLNRFPQNNLLNENNKVGVFVGAFWNDYEMYSNELTLRGVPVAFGNSLASIANMVSYCLNLHGPSMTIETMCSSSLTAIYLACQSLKNNDCSYAIAGGVNIVSHPHKYLFLKKASFLSSEGKCKSFASGGDGYVPGEGVGAVLLTTLERAKEKGYQIYGVIKGGALNHGGKTAGITVPDAFAQAEVIKSAIQNAKISPENITYIEAHGTGTSLGDPIEIQGLTKAFQKWTSKKNYCGIGSVKSNIGHLESASGIVGLTKILLQFKYKELFPSLYSTNINPIIKLEDTPFFLVSKLEPWHSSNPNIPKIAALSSFGANGSNAHLIIEEYVNNVNENIMQESYIIPLSAHDEFALRQKAKDLLAFIEQCDSLSLINLAYTLQLGREAMKHRIAFVITNTDELLLLLQEFLTDKSNDFYFIGKSLKKGNTHLQDSGAFITKWEEKEDLLKIAQLWVDGEYINWNNLYSNTSIHYINLPTYPFKKERYWITQSENNNLSVIRKNKNNFLIKKWKIQNLVSAPSNYTNSSVLILSTTATLTLAKLLDPYFKKCDIVIRDNFSEILDSKVQYDGIIDLTGCDDEKQMSLDWIEIIQRLVKMHSPVKLLCITCALEAFENERINLSGALRAGLYRMLQSEYSKVKSCHVDIERHMLHDDITRLIISEYYCIGEDAEVCYRRNKRYVPYLEKCELEGCDRNISFSSDQVLLITGGTRGLGAVCAEHFICKYGVKKILLMGQVQLPDKTEWHSFAKDDKSMIAQRIHLMQKLESYGAEVRYLSTPLADSINLRNTFMKIEKEFGLISGVIHCAGKVDMETPAFIKKTQDSITQILNPKVQGLQVLAECLDSSPLQFFILFSSISSVIPSLAVGQSDYAMANSFMNYWSTSQNKPYPVISITWPSWKDTGMGEVKSKVYQNMGLDTLSNREGVYLLDQILKNQHKACVILPIIENENITLLNWGNILKNQQYKSENNTSKSKESKIANVNSYSMKHNVIEWLINSFSELLDIKKEDIDVNTELHEYGADSIIYAQAIKQLSSMLKIDIDPSILYEYPTIELLSNWLSKTYSENINNFIKNANTDKEQNLDNSKKIAVIGMACKFPNSPSLEDYWNLLLTGNKAIKHIPFEHWGYSTSYSAGLLEKQPRSTGSFFNINDIDAELMDPQALLLLESTLNACCDAGYLHETLKGQSIGVYIGARTTHKIPTDQLQKSKNPIMLVGQNYLAANISHFFDFKGPAMVIDTACSSALVSISVASQALFVEDIEMAVVGGVNILNDDAIHKTFEQRGILNKNPEFHVFDQRSNGLILGEGVGVILLKRLDKAINDGDRIYAIIDAISVNNDGHTAGPATPNIRAFKDVMQKALSKAKLDSEQIKYIEANASGIEVTDLLELKAIQAIYRNNSKTPCALGSFKPNIGHPLCAEGIAGFIKLALMLYHKKMPPFLSGQEDMQYFDIQSSPFYFIRKSINWTETPRFAALNCFADGGTNVHVILESMNDSYISSTKRNSLISPLSNIPNNKTKNVINFWKKNDD